MNAYPDDPTGATAEERAGPTGGSNSFGARDLQGAGDSSGPADSQGTSAPGRENTVDSLMTPGAGSSADMGTGDVGTVTGASPIAATVVEMPRDPAWTTLDVLRIVILGVVALFVGVFTVLLVAHFWIYPRTSVASLARIPLVVVFGQAVAYLLVLAYMYILVTRERGCPKFFAAIHWNWPRNVASYLFAGIVLSLALQVLARLLPTPKSLPIDTFFSTPAEAWVLTIFGVTLAPLMEELFFRGFLYPVVARGLGATPAIFITAFAFALLHGSQLLFSWGPVLVIFLVGTVLTMVRAYKNSVAAGLLIHIAYNGTISVLMFIGTDGFRHLEKLNQ